MTTNRIIVGAHYGLGSWLVQRVTAIVMALYTLVFLVWSFSLDTLSYGAWVAFFASPWVKVLTLMVMVALLWHAWVGVRNIFMDYIKPTGLRLALQAASIVLLFGYAAWTAIILWSV